MSLNSGVQKNTAQRACDACRTRKIRCNKGSPCSNCKSNGSICRVSQQDSEPRSRVIISKEYEKKIDRIVDRLGSIEELLRAPNSLSVRRSEGSDARSRSVLDTSLLTPKTTLDSSNATSPAKLDLEVGDATTSTHSAVASRIVEQAVGNGVYQSYELAAALNSLKDMVNIVKETPNSNSTPSRLAKDAELVEPATNTEIDELVNTAENSITLGFIPGLTVPMLRTCCNNVLINGTDSSPISRLYVYGVLWNLCSERTGLQSSPALAKRCRDLVRLFTARVEEVVTELPLVMPVTALAASALTMGAGIAVELSKPHLAMTLSSQAASIVLSLGYHRLSNLRSDTETERQSKILLFWMTYWLDTSFAVRLGRAPVIQHYDITVPRFSHGSIVRTGWVDAFNYCTRIGSLQCQVVEQLYSPLSLEQSAEERLRRASRLLKDLQRIWDARGDVPPGADDDTEHGLQLLLRESNAVTHHSTIALVQHATMSSTDNESPALESARRALRLNIEAWHSYKYLPDFIWTGHCHWTLLNVPMTPFIVIFCHIIVHPFTSNVDLSLLAEFVTMLQHLCRFSEGVIKLYRLCDTFSKVGNLYVQAKHNQSGPQLDTQPTDFTVDPNSDWIGQPAVNNIDDYLSAMGFLPPSDSFTGNAEYDTSFLADWYQGNSSLMGLLEQDLTFPGSSQYGYPSETSHQ